jgi:hypothetical protein
MTPDSKRLLSLARRGAAAYEGHLRPRHRPIALGGSVAEGIADADSDVDMGGLDKARMPEVDTSVVRRRLDQSDL